MAKKLYDEKQTLVGAIRSLLKVSRATFYRYVTSAAPTAAAMTSCRNPGCPR